ncbi:MAG TPA: hypothetical protein VFQ25_04165 [Ktedonobacterales bacterium]|nr:hypothetical protein [Ktedonobacterales bacterium]
MTTIGIILGGILVIAFFAREFNWRTRAALLAVLAVMAIILIR